MNAVTVLYGIAALNLLGAAFLAVCRYNRSRKTIWTDIAQAKPPVERAGKKRAAEFDWSNRDA